MQREMLRWSYSMTGASLAPKSNADWWKGAVIYQIYPRSFQDSSGTGIGTLNGITRRLPHVASLGVDAIWLSPFFTSPQADMGYDVSDYCNVDPMFGTLADFDTLVAEAHRLNLKVMIDQVISHTSDQHPWFKQSRASRDNARADWYIWADPKPDGTAPNNWLSIFGGPAWEWDGVRRQYYMHNFLTSQPDLNFHTPAVQDALLETVKFWLERGVDGFRLDTVNYYFHDASLQDNPPLQRLAGTATADAPETNPYSFQNHLHDKTQPENIGFLKRFRALLDQYDDRTAVGEVGDDYRSLTTVAAYTSDGDKLHMCYTFDLLSPEFSATHIRKCVVAVETQAPTGWICWAFSNHDVMRHVSRFTQAGDDTVRIAKIALTVIASLRGSLCLYEGEELGLTEADLAFEDLRDPYGIRFWPSFKGRDGCRTPMVWEADAPHAGFTTGKPWLPVPKEHVPMAVDRQEGVPASVLAHYRETLAFRKAHEAMVDGDFALLQVNQDLLAFTRKKGDEAYLFVFNLTREPQEFVIPNTVTVKAQVVLPGFKPGFDGKTILLDAMDAFCATI
jgi:alpha-glucosidase